MERQGILGSLVVLLGGVEVESADTDVLDAHLLKYSPFDHFKPHLWRYLNGPIKRSFTLIINSMQWDFFQLGTCF